MCKVGHAKNNQKVDVSEFIQRIDHETKVEDPLCPTCYSIKHIGQPHTCAPKSETISNIQQHMPQKLQEQLSAKVIKDKASGSNETKLSTGGTPLNVSVGTSKSTQQKSFSHEDIISMKRDMHLSDNKTLRMAKHIRE